MARLPPIAKIDGNSAGTGFFYCVRKERRTGRGGPFLVLLLQDVSGEIDAKVFQDVDVHDQQFEAAEFVAVQGRGNLFNHRLELVVDRIRRVIPDDVQVGFREEDCIPCAPRPIEEMWTELGARIESVADPHIRALLQAIVTEHESRLRIWPAARQVHHAYRGGLLEHILKIMDVAGFLADTYAARRDLVLAGALLHDIGKLQELLYDISIDYSVEGNLLGHIALGAAVVREAAARIPGFPHELAIEILAAADDLDAKLQQARRHVAEDSSDRRFTTYHRYLERVLLKPPRP
jgi:3'-5' exoribonuclease